METTSVINQKGGVGKTSLAVGLAAALADRGRRVLLVDLDPQGHATTMALQLDEVEDDARLAAALTGDYTGSTAALAVQHSETESGGSIDVWRNSIDMFIVERKLFTIVDREKRLARLLEDVADDYDHAVIDCPPALNTLTDNALAGTDGVLIPVQPERASMRALKLLLGQITSLEQGLRRSRINIHGLVPGLYRRPLTVLARTVMADYESLAPALPIVAHLPTSVAVGEAWDAGQPVTRFAPDNVVSDGLREIAAVVDKAAA